MKDLDPNNHQVNVGSGSNTRDGVGWRTALQKINKVFESLDEKKVSVEGDTINGYIEGSNNYGEEDSSSNFVTTDDLSIKLDENREDKEYKDPVLLGEVQIENQLSQSSNQTSTLPSLNDIEDVILEPFAPLEDPSFTGDATLDDSSLINQEALESTLSDYAPLEDPSFTGDATLDDSSLINQEALESYAAPIENPDFKENASVEGNAIVTESFLEDQLDDYAPLDKVADFSETPSVNGENVVTEDTLSDLITKEMIESHVMTILEEQGLIEES